VTALVKTSRWGRKSQFSGRHYKFPTEFQQTAANFWERRLWVLKTLPKFS